MCREGTPRAAGLVLIDTSVWIAALDPAGDDGCRRQVSALLTSRRAATCEIVVAEVLRGAEDDREAQLLEERLRSLVRPSMDGVGAVAAAIGRPDRYDVCTSISLRYLRLFSACSTGSTVKSNTSTDTYPS